MTERKLCIDCKHATMNGKLMSGFVNISDELKCMRRLVLSDPDLVSGYQEELGDLLLCKDERYNGGGCGLTGKYWEPKKESE